MKGYIYALYSIEYKEYPIYIGSTIQKIYMRHTEHRKNYRNYLNGKYHFISSFILYDKFGFEGVAHKLIKEVEVDSRKELFKYERETIEEYKDKCLNIMCPYRTEEERKELKKEWEEQNKNKIKANKKENFFTKNYCFLF